MPMETAALVKFSTRLLLVWLALSVSAFIFRQPLGEFLLPFVDFGMREWSRDFAPGLALAANDGDYLISVSAWVLRPIPVVAGYTVNPGAQMTAGTHLTHTLVPPVITLSLVLAWPGTTWAQRGIAAIGGIVQSLLLVTVTVPLLLLGNLEMMFQNMAEQAGRVRPVPFSLDVMLFLEGGGRWLLAVLAGLLSVRAGQLLAGRWQATG
ncbi:hypothetical protein PL263_08065 [Methylomonas sp. EFPC3]|uniref:hypothetical protein n=1 Tax=Methylomonas sp. EFPC3 TaxID=3021710 RepID=UPI00241759EF|nr:hypothetical protein [Methylomonas sp. EFPC3]WFP51977.1 hypothetical protein PL263_08065 [Methylomonas sp. EFPC3]